MFTKKYETFNSYSFFSLLFKESYKIRNIFFISIISGSYRALKQSKKGFEF